MEILPVGPKTNRTKLLLRLGILGLFIAALLMVQSIISSLGRADTELSITEAYKLQIPEVSGLALDQKGQLVAVGDNRAELALMQVASDPESELQHVAFDTLIFEHFRLCANYAYPTCKDFAQELTSDWEAVDVDKSGRIFLLQEFSSAIYVLDAKGTKIEGRILLHLEDEVAPKTSKGKKKQKKQENSGMEGIILLPNGHILAAKEQKPRLMIEFGPKGAKPTGLTAEIRHGDAIQFAGSSEVLDYVPLKSWNFTDSRDCDISDLALDPTRSKVFTLSETCQEISELQLDIDQKEAKVVRAYRVPAKVKNPEGLVALSSGEWFVASDRGREDKKNLFRVRVPQ